MFNYMLVSYHAVYSNFNADVCCEAFNVYQTSEAVSLLRHVARPHCPTFLSVKKKIH